MKKLITLLAVMVMLFVATAQADTTIINENFSIRNGITFMMHKNQVMQIETQSGSDKSTSPSLLPEELGYGTTLLGYEARIGYWFDNNLILEEFQYELYSATAYSAVVDTLTNKYGTPTFTSSSPFDTRINSSKADWYKRMGGSLSATTRDYKGWLVQYHDCYVVIEVTSVYFQKLGTLYFVNYCPMSYEEVEAVMNNFQSAADNDL